MLNVSAQSAFWITTAHTSEDREINGNIARACTHARGMAAIVLPICRPLMSFRCLPFFYWSSVPWHRIDFEGFTSQFLEFYHWGDQRSWLALPFNQCIYLNLYTLNFFSHSQRKFPSFAHCFRPHVSCFNWNCYSNFLRPNKLSSSLIPSEVLAFF